MILGSFMLNRILGIIKIIMVEQSAQFSKVVLEIIVSLSRFMSIFVQLIFSFDHPMLACYELAAELYLGYVDPNYIYTEPGSVGDISGSCTSKYGEHQVPFAFELYLDQ